jgi:hypothetical protein
MEVFQLIKWRAVVTIEGLFTLEISRSYCCDTLIR